MCPHSGLSWSLNSANCIVSSNMGMRSTVPPKTHSITDSVYVHVHAWMDVGVCISVYESV